MTSKAISCAGCGAKTNVVVIWNGKAVYLCPPCGEKIRMPMNTVERLETVLRGSVTDGPRRLTS